MGSKLKYRKPKKNPSTEFLAARMQKNMVSVDSSTRPQSRHHASRQDIAAMGKEVVRRLRELRKDAGKGGSSLSARSHMGLGVYSQKFLEGLPTTRGVMGLKNRPIDDVIQQVVDVSIGGLASSNPRGLLGTVVGNVASMTQSAVNVASSVANTAMSTATNVASQAASTVVNAASSVVQTASNVVSSTATNVASTAMDTASNVVSNVASTAQNVISTASQTAQSAVSSVQSIASQAANAISSATQSIANLGSATLTNATQTISNAATNAVTNALDTTQNVVGYATNAVQNATDIANAIIQQNIQLELVVPTPKVVSAITEKVAGELNSALSVMDAGVAELQILNNQVGGLNGAMDLLTASIQNALDDELAHLMKPIVDKIRLAHSYTHPLFMAIFEMTWSQNRQWIPNLPGGAAVIMSEWMEVAKSIPEYLDFIQKVFGGALGQITKGADAAFATICDIGAQLLKNPNLKISFPVPNLSIPLMSISKQIEEVLNKIMLIKEIIRQKAKLLLSRLKKLQAPSLYINLPEEFLVVLDVLVEAQFIYANLPIVMDKILEYFINLFVKKFADVVDKLIGKILDIWQKVIEIVPPLNDLIQLIWAVPNQADLCVNLALNIALPNMWSMVKPYVDMPFQCIDMVSQACDRATELAYAIPEP